MRRVLKTFFIYILEHPSRQEGEKNWAAFQADPEWHESEGRLESETNGPLVMTTHRSVFHGPDQLFSPQLVEALIIRRL